MIRIEATYYDGRMSAQVPVTLKVCDTGGSVIESGSGEILLRQMKFSAKVSDRLADTPRYLTFPDGTVLETEDNQAVDRLLKEVNGSNWTHWIHFFESKKRYALLAGMMVILIGVGMVKYGVPAAAKLIASRLPLSVFAAADRQVLELLDRMVFKSSELPAETESRVRKHFQPTIASHEPLAIQLLFREGGRLGPNAFALPGGTIVFTDELVRLAEHDDELLGILAHEIGHVVHQHAMRRMVQSSMISFAFLALTGDASGVSELFLGLPVMLTELSYSRGFEREADEYALTYLQERNIAPARFADILERIAEKFESQTNRDKESRWSGYLATHPATSERIKAFRSADAF
jgi:Zn-dependent protease with chaperone function